jgi:integrase
LRRHGHIDGAKFGLFEQLRRQSTMQILDWEIGARRLAEAGCTMHEIAAIIGHASLNEVQRYTKAADQARLARAAMEKAK